MLEAKDVVKMATQYFENEYLQTSAIFQSESDYYKKLVQAEGGKNEWVERRLERIFAVAMFVEMTLDIDDNWQELLQCFHKYYDKLKKLKEE